MSRLQSRDMGLLAMLLASLVVAFTSGVALASGSACPDSAARFFPPYYTMLCDVACPGTDTCRENTTYDPYFGAYHTQCSCWNGSGWYSPAGTLCILERVSGGILGGDHLHCITALCSTTCGEPVIIPEDPPNTANPKYGCPCGG